MELRRVWIKGYRSVFDFRAALGRLNVIVGENGTGKTNVYRALQLMGAAADGRFLEEIALEGGFPSASWAGPRAQKRKPVRIVLGAGFADLSVEMQFGLVALSPGPPDPRTLFKLDPEVKEEVVWPTKATPRSWLFRRRDSLVEARDRDGLVVEYAGHLRPRELGLSELKEPATFPELAIVRDRLVDWRFYHEFRTDQHSPLRQRRVGWHSPVLASDGTNLVATLQTIRELGHEEFLDECVERMLGGGSFGVVALDGVFDLEVFVPGLLRPLTLHELSDGQLRFFCLAAALLSPRPPEFIVLNEPESSLFADLLPLLADLIADASRRSQVWVTTHSSVLADLLDERAETKRMQLLRENGKTTVAGQSPLEW